MRKALMGWPGCPSGNSQGEVPGSPMAACPCWAVTTFLVRVSRGSGSTTGSWTDGWRPGSLPAAAVWSAKPCCAAWVRPGRVPAMSGSVGEPRNVAEACALEACGHRLKYVFFWGHQPVRPGQVGRACLSQWWESAFAVDGVTYRTAEHWMMAQKARLFGDEDVFARIVAAPHPKVAKDLGRQVRGFEEDTWIARRFEIVTAGSVAKFGQDPALKEYLLGTSRRVLVEASPRDQIWGIGLSADDDRASRPSQWRGLNLLGFALMQARAALSAAAR